MPTDEANDPIDWLERHGDALYRFAITRLRDPDAAADVVQEAFLDGLRGRDRFAGLASERTWLIGILKRKIADHYRRRGREVAGLDESDDPDAPSGFDRRGLWKDGPRRWPGDPHSDLEQREFWLVLETCLSKMPSHLAQAYLAREMDEIPTEELCQQLGITPTNLWARLHRARMLLRACLEHNWFGPSRDDRRP
jgi:RNA polymerase sigma-70 factor (ECF subfamily)